MSKDKSILKADYSDEWPRVRAFYEAHCVQMTHEEMGSSGAEALIHVNSRLLELRLNKFHWDLLVDAIDLAKCDACGPDWEKRAKGLRDLERVIGTWESHD